MNGEWRTSQVLALCRGMREEQNFALLPILADALEDAGCDDANLLIRLRDPRAFGDYAASVLAVAEVLLHREEYAHAVDRLGALSAEIGGPQRGYDNPPGEQLGVGGMINAGHEYLKTGECVRMGCNEHYSDFLWEETFWQNYQTLTGAVIPEGTERDGFFSCAC
jgi:hypothetical protein